MTHHQPYGPDELDRPDAELDGVAHALERFAADSEGMAPADLTGRILAAIDREPDPARGWWATLLAGPQSWRPAGRLAAVATVAAIAVVGAVALSGIVEGLRPSFGSSAPPSPVIAPSETSAPSPSTTVSPSPSTSASPSPSPTVAPSPVPATPVPTASDDDDDDEETPEPSESDNSGPGGGGGGGDDNSGPGGGGDDG